jgi:hypothetical protein
VHERRAARVHARTHLVISTVDTGAAPTASSGVVKTTASPCFVAMATAGGRGLRVLVAV